MRQISFHELRPLLQHSKTGLLEKAQHGVGGCLKVYLHWTAGHYHQTFSDYHLLVDSGGELYATVDDLGTLLNHTYMRNTGSIAISALCGVEAVSTTDLGPEPPTDFQIEAIAQVMTVISKEFNLPLDIQHFLTHAEAADNMDGEQPPYEPNGFPDGKYGPANSVERWDFWVLKAGDPAGSGGDILRGKAMWYLQNQSSFLARRVYRLKPDLRDLRDHIFRATAFMHPMELPLSIDLRAQCSPVVDQGTLGSCTANAIVSGLREYLLLQAKLPWVALSRLFLYYEERLLEGTVDEDSGAYIRDGMKVLQTIGVCPESEDLYDIGKFTEPPSALAIADAKQYKISQYHRVTDLTMLKTALAEKQPVVVGIKVYQSFESQAAAETGIIPLPNTTTEELLGGHAVLAVGYDDAKQWIIIRNSWGTSWGDKGYCYLPYQYWSAGLVTDMWTGTADATPAPKSFLDKILDWVSSLFKGSTSSQG
ncbi:MAG: C1 family peptidase [Negativicutes bacterium]|nr:C1 family peptidase [Negativicutes bacterium]